MMFSAVAGMPRLPRSIAAIAARSRGAPHASV
jgi:hypothetical protein